MTNHLPRAASRAALALALAGCAALPRMTPPVPASAERWQVVSAQAEQQVAAGRHAEADRLLGEFQQVHAGTPEAPEALFYRALYRLDAANPAASPQEAIGLLDSYLAMRVLTPHRPDAIALRRIAAALEAKPAVVTVTVPRDATATSPSPAPRPDTGAKDEEIARLREELSKANAELERIRRRLATPKP
ncbi:MAG: hypothetical protein JWL60_1463 [Gemmatimonadetes bacterium]|jgi:hypothetical protein|nr:hypothetical protein [Gemmatimonadota bacterium]